MRYNDIGGEDGDEGWGWKGGIETRGAAASREISSYMAVGGRSASPSTAQSLMREIVNFERSRVNRVAISHYRLIPTAMYRNCKSRIVESACADPRAIGGVSPILVLLLVLVVRDSSLLRIPRSVVKIFRASGYAYPPTPSAYSAPPVADLAA